MTAPALPTPLIDATALAARLAAGAATLIVDCSFELSDPAAGEAQFAEAHLPGAVYAHLDRDLAGPRQGPDGRFRGRHPLPDRAAFAATLGRWGLRPGMALVVYDRQGAGFAARLWWLARWAGHEAVAVLDGGLAAWQAAGGSIEHGGLADSTARPATSTPYPPGRTTMPTLDAEAVQALDGRLTVIDARAGERFRGEVEPLDAVAGHIPGALNRFFKDNLGTDGRFKPAGQLREDFAGLIGDRPLDQVVHQCGSGVTACHNLLALAVAGLDGSRLYPGSWSEWCSDPARPVATGA
nr:sulfurtransferase [Aquariibacter albus]